MEAVATVPRETTKANDAVLGDPDGNPAFLGLAAAAASPGAADAPQTVRLAPPPHRYGRRRMSWLQLCRSTILGPS